MRFTTEEGEEIREITAQQLRQVLSDDAFGKFAVLEANEHEFIQAGCDWQPTKEVRRFLAKHRSDPWLLEARGRDALFRVTRHVTLDEVIKAFTAYLERGTAWQEDYEWALVDSSGRAASAPPQSTANDQKSAKPPKKRSPTKKTAATKKTVVATKKVATKKTVATKKSASRR